MRSLFAWIMFAGKDFVAVEERMADGTTSSTERIPLPSPPRIVLAVIISMACCLAASYAWAQKVEPWFGRVTKAAEEVMMGKGGPAAERGVLPVRKE